MVFAVCYYTKKQNLQVKTWEQEEFRSQVTEDNTCTSLTILRYGSLM